MHFAPALVVSGEDQRFFIKRQLQTAVRRSKRFCSSPSAETRRRPLRSPRRGLDERGSDELLLLMPSDHVIGDRAAFIDAVRTGVPHAEGGAIVTFGAEPTGPNTQYGYIEGECRPAVPDGAFPIARFVEKPNAEKAAEYVAERPLLLEFRHFPHEGEHLLDEMRAVPARKPRCNRAEAGGEQRPTDCSSGPRPRHSARPKTSRSITASWRRPRAASSCRCR